MEFFKAFVESKSGGSPSLHLEWRTALAAHPLFSMEMARPLLLQVESPAQLLALAEMARALPPGKTWSLLIEAVDASDAPLREWLQSLLHMRDFLRREARRIDLPHAIGYVECCATAATTTKSPLSETVAGYLHKFGVDP
jgi:hypothetical protein